jgi:hypothetical protein
VKKGGRKKQQKALKMLRAGKPVEISPDLAHEIIYGGIEYAKQFGFRPHRDFDLSQFILDPPDAHPRTGKAEFGKDGKPFYISGPYDDVDAILRQLVRTAGEGNYHFMTQIGGPPPDEWEEDEDVEDALNAIHEVGQPHAEKHAHLGDRAMRKRGPGLGGDEP